MEFAAAGSTPLRRALLVLAVLAVTGVLGGYGVAVRARPKPVRIELSPSPDAKSRERFLFVHVAGAVARPGLYRVPDGARVDDAIRAAGGPLPDAVLDAINLASQVRDGDKVLVPAATNGDGPPGAGTTEERVNLNSATVAELETLPGIGPALAERIVAYREQHGPFRTVKDVQKVPGIGPAKFEGLADLVTV